jgi:hypothetical protein
MAAPNESALGNFMSITAKSTVAVVIPLYGFWNDIKDNPVNGEVLGSVIGRVYSQVHHLIYIFVAHPQTIENDPLNPESVHNILLSKAVGGNVLNVAVERDAPYADYVQEGITAALEDTKAQFIVVFNPWVLIQEDSIDVIVDRANYGDKAKIVSGFDMRSLIEPEGFASYKNTQPIEQWDLNLDLLCMPRFIAEMLTLDPEFKTHAFLERDMWQQIVTKGFDVISSQRIPIFPFDFPWTNYETRQDFAADEVRFQRKWHFNPGLKHRDN